MPPACLLHGGPDLSKTLFVYTWPHADGKGVRDCICGRDNMHARTVSMAQYMVCVYDSL